MRRLASSIRHKAANTSTDDSSISCCDALLMIMSACRKRRTSDRPASVKATMDRRPSFGSDRASTWPRAVSCLIQPITSGWDCRSSNAISVTPSGPRSSSASSVEVVLGGALTPISGYHSAPARTSSSESRLNRCARYAGPCSRMKSCIEKSLELGIVAIYVNCYVSLGNASRE